jgi:hypothetical protein
MPTSLCFSRLISLSQLLYVLQGCIVTCSQPRCYTCELVKEPATPEHYDVASESFPVDKDAIDTNKNMPSGCRRLDNVMDTQANPLIQCD